jgi:hypothetical protein
MYEIVDMRLVVCWELGGKRGGQRFSVLRIAKSGSYLLSNYSFLAFQSTSVVLRGTTYNIWFFSSPEASSVSTYMHATRFSLPRALHFRPSQTRRCVPIVISRQTIREGRFKSGVVRASILCTGPHAQCLPHSTNAELKGFCIKIATMLIRR